MKAGSRISMAEGAGPLRRWPLARARIRVRAWLRIPVPVWARSGLAAVMLACCAAGGFIGGIISTPLAVATESSDARAEMPSGEPVGIVFGASVETGKPRSLQALTASQRHAQQQTRALLRAIHQGDLQAAQQLLAQGWLGRLLSYRWQHRLGLASAVDPDQVLADGSTPLAWAVESQNLAMVQLLLSHGAHPDYQAPAAAEPQFSLDANRFSPLLLACQYGDAEIIASLLRAGAEVNRPGPGGVSALALCAGNAPLLSVQQLLAAGAVVEQADVQGQTPLMWAAAHARLDTVQLLLAHGANINRATVKGFSPLFFAIKSGASAAPLMLVQAGADTHQVAADGTTAVQLAMYQQRYEFAAQLIEAGVDLGAFDRNGHQLLHAAVLANQPPLAALLLAQGADVHTPTGESQVKWGFESNFKTAPYVVPAKSPLLLAAEQGYTDMMRLLVDAGADPQQRNAAGTSTLLAAASSGSPAALALALALEPNAAAVNSTDKRGRTPLHLVLAHGSHEQLPALLQLLAERGARIDIRDSDGQTPVDLTETEGFKDKSTFAAIFTPSFTTPSEDRL